MNADKTEWTTVNRISSTTLSTKKLGSRLAQKVDMNTRIALGRKAFGTMFKIWINRKHISLKTKLFLYNMFTKSVLTYNASCLGMSEQQLKNYDSTHRKQLRLLADIRYPKTITNNNLYEMCKSKPLHLDIIKYRWRLFGHILRLDEDIPANRIMTIYYTNPEDYRVRKGRGPNNLQNQLHTDLRIIGKQLRNINDLNDLRNLAQDREAWQRQTKDILQLKHRQAMETLEKMELSSRETRRKKRALERRVELPTTDEDEQNGRKRPRMVLTAYTPLVIRINLKRTRLQAQLIDTNAIFRTPPNLRRPLAEAPSTGDSFVDRMMNAYVFV